jgi:hypothetical protein
MLFDLKDLSNKKQPTREEEILTVCLAASLVGRLLKSLSSASNYLIENETSAKKAGSRSNK